MKISAAREELLAQLQTVSRVASTRAQALSGVQFHRGVLAVAERPVLPTVAAVASGARRLIVRPHEQPLEVGMNEAGHHVPNAVDEVGRRRW